MTLIGDKDKSRAVNDHLLRRALDLIARVVFENYTFWVREAHGGVVLYATYEEPDVYTGAPALQTTRKWVLSPAMTDSEIVQTAFKLCATSIEHRLREHFTYRGKRIFGPHFDVEDLVGLCKGRENAGGRDV